MQVSKLHRWADIEPEQMNKLTTRQYVVGANTMVARLVLKTGAHVPAHQHMNCLLYTSPSPRDRQKSRMPSSA